MATAPLRMDRLDHETLAKLPQRLVVYDGICVMCSGSVKWLAARDPAARFRFTTAQSPLGQALLGAHGLKTQEFDSNLVLIDRVAYTRLDSVIAVGSELGWPWRAVRLLRILPARCQDWLYDVIAANRYALFGRRDVCDIPSSGFRERIVE